MKRATIIAKGDVQRVGYRDIVEKIARKLKVTGFVENLKPYDVKIVAEGEEDVLDEFITRIRIDDPPVFVEDIDVTFGDATHEFEYFEIMRGDPQEELGERMDAIGAMLYRSVELGRESVKIGRESVELSRESVELGKESVKLGAESVELGKVMIEKQDNHTQILTEFRDQTQQNFTILDTKYGRIADTMEKLIDEMRNERKESRAAMEKLTEAIIRLAESKK
ncbi:MAG: acylphosphatase [Methanosarcinales archaeon]|nr:acylphosphatase [Methanosarcinales archaeon]